MRERERCVGLGDAVSGEYIHLFKEGLSVQGRAGASYSILVEIGFCASSAVKVSEVVWEIYILVGDVLLDLEPGVSLIYSLTKRRSQLGVKFYI